MRFRPMRPAAAACCSSAETAITAATGARRPDCGCSAAAMFAAKEAVAKALGTGFAQGVMPWQIEVTHEQSGKPFVLLTGAAREKFEQIGGRSILLSLSHEGDTAIAFALIQ